ncbi:MAG: ABC transporter substrate-binding protein, partial [Anaerolineaceae bacterium]
YAALETGEVTFTDLGAQFLASAESNPDIEVNKGTSNSLYYLGINYKKEIFQNADFRRAIAFALDRDEIIAAAFEGEAFLNCQYLPGGTIGFSEETNTYACDKYPYDPEQSNQILDDLGWVDTNGDGVRERDGQELKFPMIFNTETTTGLAAEVIQSQLADIGIALDLQPMEAAAQAEILVAEQQDFFIRPYGLVDPVILSSMVTYPNRNAFDDAQATELRNIADGSIDFAERMQAVDNMNRYLIDNNAWFPLWTPYAYVASRAELQGEMFDFVGGIIFHNATITQ